MNYFQHEFKKKKYINLTLNYVFIIIFLSASIYITLESVKYYYKIKNLDDNTARLKNNLDGLTDELNDKQRRLNELNSNEGKEGYLRRIYPAAKEGEKLIILYDSTNTKNFEVIDNRYAKDEIDPLQKIKNFINKYTNF